jgi:hypothetical protein
LGVSQVKPKKVRVIAAFQSLMISGDL